MIDNFTLVLIHGLLAIAVWRLVARPDLDDDALAVPDDPPEPDPRG